MSAQIAASPDIQALREALAEALAGSDVNVDIEKVVNSTLSRLGREGYAIVPIEAGTPRPPPPDLIGFALMVADFCNDPQLVRAAQSMLTSAGMAGSKES